MVQLAGEDILASDIKMPRYIAKASNESVTSSTVVQDDNDLVVALGVGYWLLQYRLHYTAESTGVGNLRVRYSNTGTMTGILRSVLGGGSPSTDASPGIVDMMVRMQGAAASTELTYGANASNSNMVWEELLVPVTVAGNLTLQWAQGTSSATATTLTTSSRVIITEIEPY